MHGEHAGDGPAMLRRVAGDALAVYATRRAIWHGSAAGRSITRRLAANPAMALAGLAEAIGACTPEQRLAHLGERLGDADFDLARLEQEGECLIEAVRQRRQAAADAARLEGQAVFDEPAVEKAQAAIAEPVTAEPVTAEPVTAEPVTEGLAVASLAPSIADGEGGNAADAPVQEPHDGESDTAFAAALATRIDAIAVKIADAEPAEPAPVSAPVSALVLVPAHGATPQPMSPPADPMEIAVPRCRAYSGGGFVDTPLEVARQTEPSRPPLSSRRLVAAALLFSVAVGGGGLVAGAQLGLVQRDSLAPVLLLSRNAVNDGIAVWDVLAARARTHVVLPLSDAIADLAEDLSVLGNRWLEEARPVADDATTTTTTTTRQAPGFDVRGVSGVVDPGFRDASMPADSEPSSMVPNGGVMTPKTAVKPLAGPLPIRAPTLAPALPLVDQPIRHDGQDGGQEAAPTEPPRVDTAAFMIPPPPVTPASPSAQGRLAAVAENAPGLVCDGDPVQTSFVVRTRQSNGPNDIVAFADDALQVTADGAAALAADGNRQAWFDPTRRITTRVMADDGGHSEKSGYLPLRHAVTFGGSQYRFSFAAGERYLVNVVAERCRLR